MPQPPVATAHDHALALLIQHMADGDESALARLYDDTSPLIHGLARRILRDAGAAEEITVEVYAQAYQHAWRYDLARGTPLAWLLTMTRSRAISRLRRDARRATRELPLNASGELAAPEADPEDAGSASETRRAVLKALGDLSTDQRRAIEMAYYLGLSHTEIAARLGQPLGTVKTHIRRAMSLLRDHLG